MRGIHVRAESAGFGEDGLVLFTQTHYPLPHSFSTIPPPGSPLPMQFRIRPRPRRPGTDAASSQTRTTRLNLQPLEARDVPASGLGTASDYSAFVLHASHDYPSAIEAR